jgi:hypothetical protein
MTVTSYLPSQKKIPASALSYTRVAQQPQQDDEPLSPPSQNRSSSGFPLSFLLFFLTVVCCLAWMGGLVQLPFGGGDVVASDKFVFLKMTAEKEPLQCSSLPVVYRWVGRLTDG